MHRAIRSAQSEVHALREEHSVAFGAAVGWAVGEPGVQACGAENVVTGGDTDWRFETEVVRVGGSCVVDAVIWCTSMIGTGEDWKVV
jgi:hypothetical protein